MKKLLETYKKELKETGKVIFKIKVIAKAPKTMFRDVMQDNTIKLAVAQVAEKGKANEEICSFGKRVCRNEKRSEYSFRQKCPDEIDPNYKGETMKQDRLIHGQLADYPVRFFV